MSGLYIKTAPAQFEKVLSELKKTSIQLGKKEYSAEEHKD